MFKKKKYKWLDSKISIFQLMNKYCFRFFSVQFEFLVNAHNWTILTEPISPNHFRLDLQMCCTVFQFKLIYVELYDLDLTPECIDVVVWMNKKTIINHI